MAVLLEIVWEILRIKVLGLFSNHFCKLFITVHWNALQFFYYLLKVVSQNKYGLYKVI